ncbi:hypothetical protein [Erwinia sp. S38]|uniref:hypothetical protein n=1 Tax=Erwinia sp. S38 TaxID=2769338 RepID=UPI00190D3B8C|nr:hypothetical protein [Erwinia sp. S38]MBK0003350.1 hypothetical protein [Erwinia sp. S38]
MDDADLAQELEAAIITIALLNRPSRIKGLNGKCVWCEDQPVVANTAFCSAECCEDHRKHTRELEQRGGSSPPRDRNLED